MLSGIVIEEIPEQPEKAPSPILKTLSGIVIEVRFEQLENKMDEGFKNISKLIIEIFDNIDSSIKTLDESQKIMMKKIDCVQASDLSNKEWLNTLEYRINRIEDKVFGNRIAEDEENYNN